MNNREINAAPEHIYNLLSNIAEAKSLSPMSRNG